MKIFFDLEFTGLHQGTTPISIGMVAEDDRAFYAEFTDYDRVQVNPWIRDNVIKNLVGQSGQYSIGQGVRLTFGIGNRDHVASRLNQWLMAYSQVEFWGDVLSYDWVLLCQLYGGALSMPSWVYYVPFDLATLLKCRGIDPDVNREDFAQMPDPRIVLPRKPIKHNALWDARIIRACYFRAMGIAKT